MKTSEPKTRVIEYRETVFCCANGEHDARVVYFWRKWYCTPCLKAAIRAAGGTSTEVYNCLFPYDEKLRSEFRPTAVRRAEKITRITPRYDLPKLTNGRNRKAKAEFCENCETNHLPGLCTSECF